jgi:[acyl-carrier-protein] S-malonyltransferase
MMKDAGAKLALELDKITIRDLTFPIVNNADAKFIRTAAELKPSLLKQISSSLYWEDSINRMTAEGFDTFIEIGPGKVLSGLVKRIVKDAKVLNVEDAKSMTETLAALGM